MTTSSSHVSAIRVLAIAFLLAMILAIGVIILTGYRNDGRSTTVDQTALAYVQHQMVFDSGPQVRSTHTLILRNLPRALAAYTRPTVAQNVNVSDLERRFGRSRPVILVVLGGVFNTLPPDEGVEENGQVVVLLDARTHRPLFLDD